MVKFKKIIQRTITLYPSLEAESSSGEYLRFPDFDLLPQDYLKYAEDSISKSMPEDKINCVSNLKRAMECEIDTFFYVLGLDLLVKKRNLGFDKKLKFIEAIGLYKSKSLEMLNTIRNKVEHEYIVPNIQDIELYYELVYAFISVIEGALFMFANKAELSYETSHDSSATEAAINETPFRIGYSYEKKEVIFQFLEQSNKRKKLVKYTFDTSNIEVFASALAVYFWLVRGESLFSKDYICKQLEEISQNI